MANTEMSNRFAELTKLVEDHGTGDLDALLRAEPGGIDAALDVVFESMAGMIDPAKVKQDKGIFMYEVRTSAGVRQYVLDVADGQCTARRGNAADADITIGIALPDILAMAAGTLSGQRAFVSGKLKLSGNPLFGMKLGQWFRHR